MSPLAALRIAERFMRPVWWAMSLWRAVARRRRSGQRPRRVLLVAHNELMVRYLSEVVAALGNDPRMELRFARSPLVDRHVPSSVIAERLAVPTLSFGRALFQWWDLIISADHFPSSLFHPTIAKMFISHGLYSGKRFGENDYIYGERTFYAGGKLLYSVMLAAGEWEHRCALAVNPRLDGVVRVAGEMLVDRLLEHQELRGQIRERLGVGRDQRVLLIMSSWGERSLVQTVGRKLIEQAERLTGEYYVLVSIHPNNYTRGDRTSELQDFLSSKTGTRLHVVGQFEPWFEFLTAADVAISDHTSLCLYFAQLVRPLIFVPCDISAFTEGSPLPRLYEKLPKLDTVVDLNDALRTILADYPMHDLEDESRRMVSFKGEAHFNVRKIANELLELE